MSLLGFKERFVPAIEARRKRHSIRAGLNGHKVGRTIQLYRMVRQPGMRKIVDVDPVCTLIETIEIRPGEIVINGRALTRDSIRRLAENDGFASAGDFYEFFLGTEGDLWTGYIIHWDWK